MQCLLVAQAEVVRDAAGHDERLIDRHRPSAPLEQLLVRHLDAEHLTAGMGRAAAETDQHAGGAGAHQVQGCGVGGHAADDDGRAAVEGRPR